MSASNDAPSASDTRPHMSYTAQLTPDQIRWLRAQADQHDTTVDQILRDLLADTINDAVGDAPTSDASPDTSEDETDDTVLSRLRRAEKTLDALQSMDAADEDESDDEKASSSTPPEDAPLSSVPEDESADDVSDDEGPPSSMFDLAEEVL